jgi:hypothetical protein
MSRTVLDILTARFLGMAGSTMKPGAPPKKTKVRFQREFAKIFAGL